MKRLVWPLLFLTLISSPIFSKEVSGEKEAMELYKKGDYAGTVEAIEKIFKNEKLSLNDQGHLDYWLATCFSKMQEFDKAVEYFSRAVKKKYHADDIFYQFGQAEFARQDYAKASLLFRQSLHHNYMRESSLYYLGYLAQVQESYQVAVEYYSKLSPKEKETYQAGQFQIGEVLYAKLKGPKAKKDQQVDEVVIPQLQKAIDFNSGSTLAAQIEARIVELKTKHGLLENKMDNGKTLSTKRASLKYKNELGYDTNVITQADEAVQKAQYTDTTFYKGTLSSSYKWYFQHRHVVNPQFKASFTQNFHNTVPAVRQNDMYSLNPKLKNTYEHSLVNTTGSFIYELDYNYTAKDDQSIGVKRFNNWTLTGTVGEKIDYFKIGDSTAKVKYKRYVGRDISSYNSTPGFSLEQTFNVPWKHMILGLFSADFAKYDTARASSNNAFVFRGDYIAPELFYGVQVAVGVSMTLTNYMNDSSRGVESTFNPSVEFTKGFLNDLLNAGFKYDYTNNTSKAKTTNQYSKHVYVVELEVGF